MEQPHTHSNPTNLALFRHKITLYRFNQGGSCYCRGLKWEQGAEPPGPLTLTTVFNCGSEEGRKKFIPATGVVDSIKTPTCATSKCVHKNMPDVKLSYYTSSRRRPGEPPGPLTLTTVFNCGSDEGRKKFVPATGVDATRSSATSPCVPQTVVDSIKTPTSATSACVHNMPDGKLSTRPAVCLSITIKSNPCH